MIRFELTQENEGSVVWGSLKIVEQVVEVHDRTTANNKVQKLDIMANDTGSRTKTSGTLWWSKCGCRTFHYYRVRFLRKELSHFMIVTDRPKVTRSRWNMSG